MMQKDTKSDQEPALYVLISLIINQVSEKENHYCSAVDAELVKVL